MKVICSSCSAAQRRRKALTFAISQRPGKPDHSQSVHAVSHFLTTTACLYDYIDIRT